MPDPISERDRAGEALERIASEAERYLAGLSDDRVRRANADEAAGSLAGALPEDGAGTLARSRSSSEPATARSVRLDRGSSTG